MDKLRCFDFQYYFFVTHKICNEEFFEVYFPHLYLQFFLPFKDNVFNFKFLFQGFLVNRFKETVSECL